MKIIASDQRLMPQDDLWFWGHLENSQGSSQTKSNPRETACKVSHGHNTPFMLIRTLKQANNATTRASTQPQKPIFAGRRPPPHRLCWAEFRPDKAKTRESTTQPQSKSYFQTTECRLKVRLLGRFRPQLNELDMQAVYICGSYAFFAPPCCASTSH